MLYHSILSHASDSELDWLFSDGDAGTEINGILRFLLTASTVGGIVKNNANISGGVGGCQAEVGTSAAMAAGGLSDVLSGYSPVVTFNAAEAALEDQLGSTCDPIGGLVELPCINRNLSASMMAITVKQYTLSPLFLNAAGTADPSLAQEAMTVYAGSEDKALLKQQYVATAGALNAGRIKYYPHNHSAIFFWLDLREFLGRVPPSHLRGAENLGLHPGIDSAEEALSNYISASSGVDLIPGQECYCRDPGYFRMCYTAEPKEKVVAGITRMAEALHQLPPAKSSA